MASFRITEPFVNRSDSFLVFMVDERSRTVEV